MDDQQVPADLVEHQRDDFRVEPCGFHVGIATGLAEILHHVDPVLTIFEPIALLSTVIHPAVDEVVTSRFEAGQHHTFFRRLGLARRNEANFRVQEVYQKMKSSERLLRLNRGTLQPQARQALELSTNAYVGGKAYFLDALNAARSLLDAQMEYWKAFAELGSSVAELEEAVGQTREEFLAERSGDNKVQSFDLEKKIGAEVAKP